MGPGRRAYPHGVGFDSGEAYRRLALSSVEIGWAPVRIQRWDVGLDGPLSEETLHRKIQSLGFDIVARIYPATLAAAVPGVGREALVGVVRGLVKLTVEADALLLTAGDLAFIPAGRERRVEGVGPSTAVCFEAFRRLNPS